MNTLDPLPAPCTTDDDRLRASTTPAPRSHSSGEARTTSRFLLTETQVAMRLGLSKRTLQSWRVAGGGPTFVRISARAVRYRPEDIEAWIEERLRASTSDPGPLSQA